MEDVYAYSRLDFILAITLPASKCFKIERPTVHVIAHITEPDGAEGNAASKMISFTKFGQSIVLDILSVINLAGRVFTRGLKQNGQWVVIDRDDAIQQTAFDVPEEEYGEGENK
jgi:hypothetical protein